MTNKKQELKALMKNELMEILAQHDYPAGREVLAESLVNVIELIIKKTKSRFNTRPESTDGDVNWQTWYDKHEKLNKEYTELWFSRDQLKKELEETKDSYSSLSITYLKMHDNLYEEICSKDKENKDLKSKLEKYQQSFLYKRIDIEGNEDSDIPVVFVGVHVVAWKQEWGKPTVAFTDDLAQPQPSTEEGKG